MKCDFEQKAVHIHIVNGIQIGVGRNRTYAILQAIYALTKTRIIAISKLACINITMAVCFCADGRLGRERILCLNMWSCVCAGYIEHQKRRDYKHNFSWSFLQNVR